MKAAIEAEVLPLQHEYADYMGRYILALAFELLTETWKRNTPKLIELIHSNDYRIGTGFLATPYILKVRTASAATIWH